MLRLVRGYCLADQAKFASKGILDFNIAKAEDSNLRIQAITAIIFGLPLRIAPAAKGVLDAIGGARKVSADTPTAFIYPLFFEIIDRDSREFLNVFSKLL